MGLGQTGAGAGRSAVGSGRRGPPGPPHRNAAPEGAGAAGSCEGQGHLSAEGPGGGAVGSFLLVGSRGPRRPPPARRLRCSFLTEGHTAGLQGPRPPPLRWGLILTPTLGTSTFHAPGADAGAGEGPGTSLLPTVVCTRAGGCRSRWDARSFSSDNFAPRQTARSRGRCCRVGDAGGCGGHGAEPGVSDPGRQPPARRALST